MNNLAQKAILEYNMITPGDTVLVGLSGGADSVALLHFLNSCKDQYNITLKTAHVNHKLRGDESERDKQFVTSLCNDMNIPLSILEIDIAAESKQSGESIEECGRRIRYSFFKEQETNLIATAHTRTDSVETVLLNLVRGTGIRGLCGIPAVRDNIIRPLINCKRTDIEAYIFLNNLSFITDSSNSDTTYRRNYIRHNILPLLKEMNPSFEDGTANMMSNLYADADYLDNIAKSTFLSSKLENGYNASSFLVQPKPISSRILMELCKAHEIPFQSVHIQNMLNCLKEDGACTLPNNKRFVSKNGVCGFSCFEQTLDDFCISLSAGVHKIPNGIIRIIENQPKFDKSTKKVNKLLFKNTINYGMIGNNPVIRSRKPGDKITFAHRGITKSLKKLFIEAKIPTAIRQQIAVIADDDGVLWVEGFGSDLRALSGKENSKYFSVSLERTITDDK